MFIISSMLTKAQKKSTLFKEGRDFRPFLPTLSIPG